VTLGYLDALDEAADDRRAPVDPVTARGRMRASLAPEQLDVLDDPSRFVALRTARAAGKTSVMVSDVLDRISSVDDWRGCYGALTQDSGKEQLWDELRRQDREFGFGLRFHEHESTVIYPPTGGRLRIRDIAHARAVNKWRGKQYHRIYLDECQSMADEVLRYAAVTVLPPTLTRFRGSIRVGGTPRLRCDGWWYEITGKHGKEPRPQTDGTLRALTRPWRERDEEKWQALGWSWSLHTWPRSANPGLPDADRESDEMRRAMAATAQDLAAIAVELDGEWPDEDADLESRLYRFVEARDCWDPVGGPSNLYGLDPSKDWGFFLGCDLALKRDKVGLTLGASTLASPLAFHCDERVGHRWTVAQIADEIRSYQTALGTRLKAIVGDSQGPTGKDIFEELSRVHRIPIEKAEKGYKDNAIELVNSDLVGGRMKIKRGSVLAAQLRRLRRPLPNLPASKQPHQEDDVADAWLYTRRRMVHGWGKEPGTRSPDDSRREDQRRQLAAIRKRQTGDPWAALRGLGGGRTPW
jgi:hypothetical protein